ncbi:hypothetical protein [Bacteroides graminisolvens]|uniref:hypothetical protein n=1 Tax=Bacteroides graminisolvens TaxID=477666 RepID=UPI002409A726|nr:hypothetical protein [Bacteroides graminisolvens]
MKIQIAATVFADGFLSPISHRISMRFLPSKCSISKLRRSADMLLSKDESVISLLNQKQNNASITYFAESTPDMLDLIKTLLLYRLIDELYICVLPEKKGYGIRLLDPNLLSEWTLVRKHALFGKEQYLIYHREKV